MDADEREIFQFLKTWGSEFVGAVEIAKRSGSKKRFYDDPDWAKPVLIRLVERGVLENDLNGRYRIKPLSRKDKQKRWVAPDISKILEESGLDVEDGSNVATDEFDEEP